MKASLLGQGYRERRGINSRPPVSSPDPDYANTITITISKIKSHSSLLDKKDIGKDELIIKTSRLLTRINSSSEIGRYSM